MHILADRHDEPTQARFKSEPPTRPVERIDESVLVVADRIERLADLCAERISCAPDDDALVAAVQDLLTIRTLARSIVR